MKHFQTKAAMAAALLALCLELGACRPAPTLEPTPAARLTPQASDTPAPVTPSPTALPSAAPTLPVFQSTPSVNPTVEWLKELLPDCTERSVSPNGKWAAGVGCFYNYSSVVSTDRRLRWQIPRTYFVPDPGVLNTTYSPAFWTPDGRYLFLEIKVKSGDASYHFLDGQGLARLDLPLGSVSTILKPAAGIDYAFSFSEDGSQVGYVVYGRQPLVAYLIDQKTGRMESFKIPSPYTEAGSFAWSPDKKQVVFEQSIFDPANPSAALFSVGLYDRSLTSVLTLIPGQALRLSPLRWYDEQRIQIQEGVGGCRVYDLSLKAFVDLPCAAGK